MGVALVLSVGMAGPAHAAHEGGGAAGVVAQQLATSVHRSLACGSCHGEMEHGSPGSAAQRCQGCHRQAATAHDSGPHGVVERQGARNAPTCVSCHGSHEVRPARDSSAPTSPMGSPAMCGRCHARAAEDFMRSAHGQGLSRPGGRGASCVSCHGAHDAAGPLTKDRRLTTPRVATTCGTCHAQAVVAFSRSVHSAGVARRIPHAPTCTTCHGGHTVRSVTDPASPVSRLRVAGETCVRCHGSVKIAGMHGLPVRVAEDFRGSFHGLAEAAGDRRVANCASCHGYHEIRPSSSPFSRTNPANLGRTCGECHPGAGPRFARGGIHHVDRGLGHRLVDWVQGMYAGMVVVVIGLMVLHNGLDFRRRWVDADRQERAREVTQTAEIPELVRFTLNERIQHWTLAASFTTLAITGLALRFVWRLPWVGGQLQETVRAGTHRAAAVVFMGLAVYHLGYLVFTARGRAMARTILPRLRSIGDVARCMAACYRFGPPGLVDWREMLETIRYNLGLSPHRPAYGRFAYWEKTEYWALAWGAVIMVATGLALWLETPFLNRFPYWAFDLLRTVHFYEATLAVLAILVWHLYYTVVNPDVFPLNRAMTRGTLTREEMERDHPLDIEEDAR